MILKKLKEFFLPQGRNTREYQKTTKVQQVKERRKRGKKVIQLETKGFTLSSDDIVTKEKENGCVINDKEKFGVMKEDEQFNISSQSLENFQFPQDLISTAKEKTEPSQKFKKKMEKMEKMPSHIFKMNKILERCSAQLFIFVEAEKEKSYIYTYVTTDTDTINRNRITFDIEKYSWCKPISLISQSDYFKNLKKDLQKHIKESKDKEIIDKGRNLHNELIPEKAREKLKIANDKVNNVFVFYKHENIDYVWEWIYGEGKNKKDDFFWGDKFNIIRIREEPSFSTDSTLKIKKVAILIDGMCAVALDTANDLEKILSDKIESLKQITLTERTTNISSFDCIHVMARGATILESTDVSKHCAEMFGELKGLKGENKLNFLFLNIYSPKSVAPNEVKDLFDVSAKMRVNIIDPSFGVSEDFARTFTKYFYECLIEEENAAKAIRKAREKIDKDLNLGCERFWRLVYVVNGNPSTTVTWGKS